MKQIITLLSFAAVSLFYISCKKESKNSNYTIAGNWMWTNKDGGPGGITHLTPDNTGEQRELLLTTDKKYSYSTNTAVTSSGTYDIISKKANDSTMKSFIDFSNDQDLFVESYDASQLTLSDELLNGYTYKYIRK
jgi:hypothetical protein